VVFFKRVLTVRTSHREDRLTRQEEASVSILVETEPVVHKDEEDDAGVVDEREIWEVTTVTEEDLETTEGETMDLYDKWS